MTRPTALITGASAGIGQELARVFATRGYDLIICARREERLQALAEELRGTASVHIVTADLSKTKGPAKLLATVGDMGLTIDVLVNNAGAAFQGEFTDMSLTQAQDMVALNMRALMETTHRVLPGMIERGQGKILNVGSVVGFQAVPGMALYSATKAFVLSFTESLAEELRGTGVQISALCPGLTRTEMVEDLGADRIPGSDIMMSDARSVAEAGYDAVHSGEVIRIPGCLNQLAVNWAEFQPRWLKRVAAGIAGRTVFTAN